MEGCAASFLYNGERVDLDPASMRKTGPGVFEKTMEDGLTAVLEIGEISPDAVIQLTCPVRRSSVILEYKKTERSE